MFENLLAPFKKLGNLFKTQFHGFLLGFGLAVLLGILMVVIG